MDDLISRKAAIDKLKTIPHGNWANERYTRELWNVPSVEAVPLEPLCQWLAGYAAPPQYALQEIITGYSLQPKLQILSVNYHVEAWMYHLRELLKSGLMETEESNE